MELSRNAIEMIKNKADSHRIADELGIEIFRDNGFQLRGPCPIHKGDNPTAFSIDYSDDSPRWYCRTTCNSGGDMIDLVMKVRGWDFLKSAMWIASISGVSDIENIKDIEDDIFHERDLKKFAKMMGNRIGKYNRRRASKDLNEYFVEKCVRRRKCDYFQRRGIPSEILNFYQVGFCPAGESEWNEDRITIPFRDAHGKLMGISGRTTFGTKSGKYKILSGSNKRECLYGLSKAMPYIREKKSVIILEGFVDVWKCWMYGKRNAVAVMGKGITPEQKQLLLSLATVITIAFDGNEEGRIGAEGTIEQLKDFCTVYQILPPYNKDFGSFNEKEFNKMLKLYIKRS